MENQKVAEDQKKEVYVAPMIVEINIEESFSFGMGTRPPVSCM